MLVKHILLILICLDVLSSAVSLIDNIPIGSAFFKPRLPLVPTLIVMLFQTKTRNRTFYCETCRKNLSYDEIEGVCACETKHKIKFLNPTGMLVYKCKNSDCEQSHVIAINDNRRTRFSKLFPYGKKMNTARQLVCKTCGSKLSGDTIINFSLYCDDINLAKDYREDFFYHAFGPVKQAQDISVSPVNVANMSDIERHYEKTAIKLNLLKIPDEPIRAHLRSKNKSVNNKIVGTNFQFNIAVTQDEKFKLRASEGIIVLLKSNVSAIERQSVIDHFLVELQNLNTQGSVWEHPVLIGLCCNGTKQLEGLIDEGKLQSESDCDEQCRRFLNTNGNEGMIYSLSGVLSDFRFFLYRTGSEAAGTSDKVFNAVQPAQSLIYANASEFSHIWKPYTGGFCPKLK